MTETRKSLDHESAAQARGHTSPSRDEVLSALKELADYTNKMKWGQPWPGRYHALMERVEIAIAKAEGRS